MTRAKKNTSLNKNHETVCQKTIKKVSVALDAESSNRQLLMSFKGRVGQKSSFFGSSARTPVCSQKMPLLFLALVIFGAPLSCAYILGAQDAIAAPNLRDFLRSLRLVTIFCSRRKLR